MKVKELIKVLEKMNPDTIAYAANYSEDVGFYSYEIGFVGETEHLVREDLNGTLISMFEE